MFIDATSNDTRKKKGTALIIVMSLMMVFVALTGTLIVLHAKRDVSETRSAERLARTYAVEAGLERARLEVIKDGKWLETNTGKAKAIWANGSDEFTIGNYTIVVKVTDEAGIWSSVESTATETSVLVGPSTTSLAMTAKGATFFADYARFVHNGNLNIGNYASYGAKVHANGNMGVIGSYITFYDDVTCTGKIGYSGPGKATVTFYKSATPGVPYINLPGIDELKDLAKSAPAGAQIWDWDDPQFKVDFKNATGVFPTDDLESTIVFKQNKMDVEITSNGKTWTQTDTDVPHDGTVYTRGPVTVSGNMSRRMSVLCPTKIYIDGPLRYTDDAGKGQWQLNDKATGDAMPFDAGTNSWSMMGNWNGAEYEYVEADDWDDRKPVIDGKKITPALGIVGADTIYIQGESNNREIHAALFSSGDVIRPKVSGKKGNLWIQGCIITAGTNPVSSFFSYRCYAYDPYLYGNPPPGFPGGDAPSFKNWHRTNNRERM
jgi:hypothetical protein